MSRLIRAASGLRMPWKNGGGWTTLIAVWPESAGDENFGWRLSIAEIERSQPYSIFPGVDRRQLLLTGPGLLLTNAGERHELAEPYDVAGFSGDTALMCEPAGPCRVLNLMTRRGMVNAEMAVLHGNFSIKSGRGPLLLHVATGEYRLRAPAAVDDGVLRSGDTLVAGDGAFNAEGGAGAVMVAVRLEMRRV